jgi:hypothetical protein
MNNAQWQRRLEKLLADSPELQDALLALRKAEDEHEARVLGNLFGYQAISNCFQGFTANTITTVENQLREHRRSSRPSNYILLLLRMAACFRVFRAANNTFSLGYPLAGFALLRNPKDWALMIGAIGNGLTTLTTINGLERPSDAIASSPPEMEVVRQRRIKEERRVLDVMLRDRSGLDDSVRKELHVWEDLFNMEVHAALGSLALEGVSWMQGHNASPPLLHSGFSQKAMLTFTNRACEVAWMILRVLPLLQVTCGQFDADWTETWKILDESFRHMSLGLAAEGKPIGAAIVELLERKFDFNPAHACYMESMA